MGAEWRPVSRTAAGTMTLDYADEQVDEQTAKGHEEEPGLSKGGIEGGPWEVASGTASPRWHEPKTVSRSAKVNVSSQDVRQLLASALRGKLAEDFRLFLGDNLYYLPPVADAGEIIANSGLSRATYMPETFDCDDYALVLKSHFCEAAYKDFQRRAPHCFGLIWGELPHVHAVNWMINDDYRLRFVEPQNGQIFEPGREHGNITFMMA